MTDVALTFACLVRLNDEADWTGNSSWIQIVEGIARSINGGLHTPDTILVGAIDIESKTIKEAS